MITKAFESYANSGDDHFELINVVNYFNLLTHLLELQTK